MIEIKINEADLQRTVKRLSMFNKNVREGVRKEVNRTALNIQADARMRVPVATNRLRSSIRTRFTLDRMGAVIGSNLHYAPYVEFGTRPHWPPIAPILMWVQKKIVRDPKKAKGIAFLIARKISRVGTKKQPYLRLAAEKYKPRFFAAIHRVTKESLKK